MATRTLPTLPGCGRAATARIEAYSPAGGRLHGRLDAAVYVCAGHAEQTATDLTGAGFTPHRMEPGAVKRCGDGMDFTVGPFRILLAPPAPVGDMPTVHPAWCDPMLCTVTDDDGRGSHSTVARVDDSTTVELAAFADGRHPTITISAWYPVTDPGEPVGLIREPDESISFSTTTATVLADTLNRLIYARWQS